MSTCTVQALVCEDCGAVCFPTPESITAGITARRAEAARLQGWTTRTITKTYEKRGRGFDTKRPYKRDCTGDFCPDCTPPIDTSHVDALIAACGF